jgi:P2-related tail formation protein
MSRYDLLPPNATQLERDFSRATSFLEHVGPAVPTIRTAKRVNIPDGVVPWLIWEYGLGEILPFLDDQRAALVEGVLWQRIRGTPQSLLVVLGWLGIEAEVDESEGGSAKWAEYQLGLTAPLQGLEPIYPITVAAKISQPVRSRLQRIYAVYDYRRFVLDWSLLSEGGPLSDHTGTRPIEGGPQISFGDYRAVLIDATPVIAVVTAGVRSVEVPYDDRFILSHSIVDEEWHLLNEAIARIDQIAGGADRLTVKRWEAEPWPAEPWDGMGGAVGGKVTTTS